MAVNETYRDGFGDHMALGRQFTQFGMYLPHKRY
jgi:hypothetical protein